MTAAQWGTLVPVLVALGLAAAAWLRAQAAHTKVDTLQGQHQALAAAFVDHNDPAGSPQDQPCPCQDPPTHTITGRPLPTPTRKDPQS